MSKEIKVIDAYTLEWRTIRKCEKCSRGFDLGNNEKWWLCLKCREEIKDETM